LKKSKNQNDLLLKLGESFTDRNKKKSQLDSFFEPSFDARAILQPVF